MDDLLKLIIPAIFLIVWALGQLLNREKANPQPQPRPIPREGGGLPTRPELAPRPREPSRLPEPTMRWGDLETTAEPIPERPVAKPRRTTAESEEIVILGSEIGPPRASPHRPAARGSSRPRPAPGLEPRRSRRASTPVRPEPTPEPKRTLGKLGELATSVQPLAIDDASSSLGGSTSAEMSVSPDRGSAPKGEWIRAALTSPERVREALILNEVLGPPLARRPRRGRT